MSLTSLTYLVFLLLCVCVYYILPKKYNMICLFFFSAAFYCYAMPSQLFIMMIYIWIIFFIGLVISRMTKKGKKSLLIFGIIISSGFLFFYKYLNFSVSLFNGDENFYSLIVPIGISYITFQCIAYIVDVYNGKMHVVKNPILFFTYTLLFMKVIAGPIEQPKVYFNHIKNKKNIKWGDILSAVILLSSGFVKKIVIADTMAPYIANVFENPSGQGSMSVFLAAIMYSFQIYYDFSGYTDIARGSARLFGISLMENFNHPYMSKNIREFWRKWHISLSEWLKTYIYIPLGGSRVGSFRRYSNIMITFFISGIWHGASLTFIVWGILHGIYQVVEIVIEPVNTKIRKTLNIKENGIFINTISRVKTFILVTFAWVIFRASSLDTAVLYFKELFFSGVGTRGEISSFFPGIEMVVLVVLGLVFIKLTGLLLKKSTYDNSKTILIGVIAIWFVILSIVFTDGTSGANSFIYFDF